MTEEQKELKRARAKADYLYYKEHGICVRCGKELAFAPFVQCERCLEKRSAYASKYYKEHKDLKREADKRRKKKHISEGLCSLCNNPLAESSKNFCIEHRNKHRRHCNEHNARKKEKIVDGCPRCGKPSKPGYKLCEVHYQKSLKSLEKARAARTKANDYFRKTMPELKKNDTNG